VRACVRACVHCAVRPPRQGLVNAQDRRGWTCLHWAKTPAIAQLLLDELGAKDNIKNHKGQIPEQMHYKRAASSGGERAAITRLLAGWLAGWLLALVVLTALVVVTALVVLTALVRTGVADFFHARRQEINANKKPWE
jgi:hypothetical protein